MFAVITDSCRHLFTVWVLIFFFCTPQLKFVWLWLLDRSEVYIQMDLTSFSQHQSFRINACPVSRNCSSAWGHLPFLSNLWPLPDVHHDTLCVFSAVVSPPPVTSSLLPHRQLLSPSIFNAHYLEMNGHLHMLPGECCYIIADMGLEEKHE